MRFTTRLIHSLDWLLLAVILLLAVVTRFSWLDVIPSSLNWDEVAYGYNAWSIWKTGADEWGVELPVFLESYGDYKPALLSYLQIPFVFVFGLNSMGLRLPVVLLSIVSLGSFAWLLVNIEQSPRVISLGFSSLLAATLLALMPWHFHYSRAAMDPMVSFAFMMLGFAAFSAAKPSIKWGGVLCLILSMYTYNTARFFVPIMLLVYVFIYQRQNLQLKRIASLQNLQLGVVLLFSAFIIFLTLFTKVGSRAHSVFVLNSPKVADETNERLYRSTVLNLPARRVFSNKAISDFYLLAENYAVHFDTSFFFFNTHISSRHGFSKHGNLLLALAPFFLIGLLSVGYRTSKSDWFFLIWFFIAPLAASLSDDVPHSGRALVMVSACVYFAVRGISLVGEVATKQLAGKKIKTYALPLLLIVIILPIFLNFTLYIVDLYRFFPEESAAGWQGGQKATILALQDYSADNFEHVFISNQVIDQTLLYAFYTETDPQQVQQKHRTKTMDSFENVKFGVVDGCNLLGPSNLIITNQEFTVPVTNYETNQVYRKSLVSRKVTLLSRYDQPDSSPYAYLYDTTTFSDEDRVQISRHLATNCQ